MKIINVFILFLTFSIAIYSQGLTIGNGTIFSGGSALISLSGNWSNAGSFIAGSSTVIFNGSEGIQIIANTGGETFNNITINKAGGEVQLSNNISVNGVLTLSDGDLDLNSQTLTLGTSSMLSESAGNTCRNGLLTVTIADLNNPSSQNICGLGAEITSETDMNETTVTRGHIAQSGNDNTGIKRYYDINPDVNNALNATLVFHYDESELNGVPESGLKLFRSTDEGTTWTDEGGNLDIENDKVTLSGINSFSRWTLAGSAAPLPVEMTSFAASVTGDEVNLFWTTETEVNNYGFEVERTASVNLQMWTDWEKIGFVPGHGNSNSPKNYNFVDTEPFLNSIIADSLNYRLKQIDTDGEFRYHQLSKAVSYSEISPYEETIIPSVFKLYQNYPNPFNPETRITVAMPERMSVRIDIYDVLGKKVAELFRGQMEPGIHQVMFDGSRLSGGAYFYIFSSEEYFEVRKCMLLK